MARVLVVEDDEAFAKVLCEILRRAGHKVSLATNGVEALGLTPAKDSFDLIITDLIMPDMEGIETIHELRQGNCAAKIIAMSGGGRNTPGNYLDIALKFGAVEALAKPFSRQQLLDAIEKALGGAA